MRPGSVLGIALTLTLTVAAGCTPAEEVIGPPPTISGQGFTLSTVFASPAGTFPDVRVRVEAPERIRVLLIREGSYEVDLATTRERGHLPWFGLTQRSHRTTDVTLNLKGYLNAKLVTPGEYKITITVVDASDQRTSAEVHVVVMPVLEATRETPAKEPTLVSRGRFEFKRIGASEVTGAETYGITWRTFDPVHVGIQIRPQDDNVALVEGIDFEAIDTRQELLAAMNAGRVDDIIEIDTAQSAAAGTAFGIVRERKPIALRIAESHTSLSQAGTTVTLTGEFKH